MTACHTNRAPNCDDGGVPDVSELVDDAPSSAKDFDDHSPRLGARLLALPRRMTLPQWLMVVAIVVYVAYFTKRTLDLHHGLATSTYDSALYDQGLWLLSRFESPLQHPQSSSRTAACNRPYCGR